METADIIYWVIWSTIILLVSIQFTVIILEIFEIIPKYNPPRIRKSKHPTYLEKIHILFLLVMSVLPWYIFYIFVISKTNAKFNLYNQILLIIYWILEWVAIGYQSFIRHRVHILGSYFRGAIRIGAFGSSFMGGAILLILTLPYIVGIIFNKPYYAPHLN
jgi:hypothetical protein